MSKRMEAVVEKAMSRKQSTNKTKSTGDAKMKKQAKKVRTSAKAKPAAKKAAKTAVFTRKTFVIPDDKKIEIRVVQSGSMEWKVQELLYAGAQYDEILDMFVKHFAVRKPEADAEWVAGRARKYNAQEINHMTGNNKDSVCRIITSLIPAIEKKRARKAARKSKK